MSENQDIVRVSTGGVFNDVETLARAIKAFGERHNLVVPGGAVGAILPKMYAAGLSFVFIDKEHETYQIPGKTDLGIGKNALDRIAAAAGVRWNPHLCGRVDDNSSPFIVEYQVAGTVLQLDGTERMITSSKRIDLRAEKETDPSTWGADAQEIARQAAKADPPRKPWPQILQQRQHILSLAETKAKNRAIRSLGVRTGYAPKDLEKGFAIIRLQFTGRSDDPEVDREVQLMIARRALTGTADLYGGTSHRELPPGPPSKTVLKLSVKEAELEEEAESAVPGPAAEPLKPEPAKSEAAAAPAEAKPKEEVPTPCPPKDNPSLICGDQADDGSWPRRLCSEFTVDELRRKIAVAEKKQPNWPARWAAKNAAELQAMKAWLAFKEFDPRQGSLKMDKPETDDQVAF